MRSRIDRLGCAPRALIALAHTAIATTSCVALNCVGTRSYNHTHRLRLEKLLCLGLSRSPNGFLKVLLDPGGGLTSETAARRFQKQNSRYETVSEVKRLKIYNGYMLYVTAIPQRTQVVAGQSQRFYSGVGIFNWYGIISVRLLRSCVSRRPPLNQGG